MGNKVYDAVKFVALILLPAVGAFYFTLGQIWGLPAVEETVGTITALDTLLGVLVRQTAKSYQSTQPVTKVMGDLVMEQYPNGEVAGMKIESTHENPIFVEGTLAAYNVKRKQIPEMDPAQE